MRLKPNRSAPATSIPNWNYRALRLISAIVIIGLIVGVIRAFIGGYLYGQYPYNTFLFDPADRFNDLFNMVKICAANDPYFNSVPFSSNYFPVANSFFYAFSFLQSKILIISVFAGCFLLGYCYLLKKQFTGMPVNYLVDVFIIFFLSYAMLFNWDRMNLEIYNFLLCFFWVRYRNSKFWLIAIILLSISISFKLYTGVFIILYLKDRKYKEILMTGAFVLLFSVVSISLFKHSIAENFDAMIISLNRFTTQYNSTNMGLHHNLSIFGMMKIMIKMMLVIFNGNADNIAVVMQGVLPYYSVSVFLLFGGTVYFILKRNLPGWMNLFLLIAVFLLFPHVSFDYKLIFIYIPLIYFLQDPQPVKSQRLFTIGFALLLIPHNYVYLFKDVSTAVFIYPAIILIMVLGILLTKTKTIA